MFILHQEWSSNEEQQTGKTTGRATVLFFPRITFAFKFSTVPLSIGTGSHRGFQRIVFLHGASISPNRECAKAFALWPSGQVSLVCCRALRVSRVPSVVFGGGHLQKSYEGFFTHVSDFD